jgi:N-acetyl sugar amidotransferase
MTPTLRVCTRCILDSKDYPAITFDQSGVCNICNTFDELKRKNVFSEAEGQHRLHHLLNEIRNSSKGKEYDCLLTISGGADSSYLAYLCKQWGLRPLALHVDNGWNTELAVKNIEQTVQQMGFDLFTFVIDWQELRDLQLAYFKSSVVDLDIPSENALIGAFFRIARKHGLRYILTGHNVMTEGWLPPNFTSQYKLDSLNLRAIQKRFGTMKLKKYPSIGFFRNQYYTRIAGFRMVNPLNLVPYEKKAAIATLTNELGWREYGSKHYENIFTRFYQGYILPVKYGIDKRKAHYSTLICSGQLDREEALVLMRDSPYADPALLEADKNFLLKKLGLSPEAFDDFMKKPPVPHSQFPSYITYYSKLKPVIRWFKKFSSASSLAALKN